MAAEFTGDASRATGRQTVFAELDARRSEFIGFVRRRVPADTDPEDLVQQAFLSAARRIDQLNDAEKALAWFYTILRRTLADAVSASVSRRDKLPLLRAEVDLLPESDSSQVCDCSVRLVTTLPAQYAEILRRVDIDGEEPAEVAQSMGTTSGNVAVRLHRARKALRERLRTVCGTTSVGTCQDCRCASGPAEAIGDSV